MGLVTLIFLRIGALTGERVAFHGLGQDYTPLATTTIAYGGAAVLLWIISAATGHLEWIGSAFWPASVYAVSFVCYTAALALGPVGLVSGFANVTVLMLFALNPRWDAGSVLGLFLFIGGSVVMAQGASKSRDAKSVLWMLASGAMLVVGRLLDFNHLPPVSIPYAASLFTAVLGWLAIPVTVYGIWGKAISLVQQRPGWVFFASGFNGLSYVSVLELLRFISPTLVEAVSACAAVGATAAGVVVFREDACFKKSLSAAFITAGTLLMLFSRTIRLG